MIQLLNHSVKRAISLSLQPNNQIAIALHNERPQKLKQSDREADFRAKVAAGRLSKIDRLRTLSEVGEGAIADALSLVRNLNANLPGSGNQGRAGGWGTLPRVTTFSRFAQSSIHQIGGAWQLENFSPGHCLFITGTLPGGTEAAKSAIASWSGYIVNRLMQYVRRQGLQQWMYCWELQKRGALHLHLVLYCPSFKLRNWWITNFKQLWYDLLIDVSAKAETDLFERENRGFLKIESWKNHPDKIKASAEICRKNIAGYLAKYMSKASQGDKNAFTFKDGKRILRKGFYCPSRWWGSSYSAKKSVRKYQKKWLIPINGHDLVTESYLDILDLFNTLRTGGTSYLTPDNNSHTEIIYYSTDGFDSRLDAFNSIAGIIEGFVNIMSFPRCDIGANKLIQLAYQAQRDEWETTVEEYFYNCENWYRHRKLSHSIRGI